MVCKGRSEGTNHFTVTRFAVTRLELNGHEPRIHGLIATTRHYDMPEEICCLMLGVGHGQVYTMSWDFFHLYTGNYIFLLF